MQITSKGQVTIPQDVRNRLGLLPHTEVEFEVTGDYARIRKARPTASAGVRGKRTLEALRGNGRYAHDYRRNHGINPGRVSPWQEGEVKPALTNLPARLRNSQGVSGGQQYSLGYRHQ